MTDVRVHCSRNHRLVRWEPMGCGEHEHRLYLCGMRLGSRRCGEQLMVPPMSGACGGTKDPE